MQKAFRQEDVESDAPGGVVPDPIRRVPDKGQGGLGRRKDSQAGDRGPGVGAPREARGGELLLLLLLLLLSLG